MTFVISKLGLPLNIEISNSSYQNFERQLSSLEHLFLFYTFMNRNKSDNSITKANKHNHSGYPGGEESDIAIAKDTSLEDIQLTSDEEIDQEESPIFEKKREDSRESVVTSNSSSTESEYKLDKERYHEFNVDSNYYSDEIHEDGQKEYITELEDEDESKIGVDEDTMIENRVLDSTLRSGILWGVSFFLSTIIISAFLGLLPMGDPNFFFSSWKTSVIVYPICGVILSYVAYSHFLSNIPVSSPLKPNIWAILIVFLFVINTTNIFVALFGWFPLIGLIEIIASTIGTNLLILLFESRSYDGNLRIRFNKAYQTHIYLIGATIFSITLTTLYLIWFANIKIVGQSILPILLILISIVTRKIVNMVADKKDMKIRIISLFFVTNGIDNLYMLSLLPLLSPYSMISIAAAYFIAQIICLLQMSTVYWNIRRKVISMLIPSRYQIPLNYTKEQRTYSMHKAIELIIMILNQIISMTFFLILSVTLRISWNREYFPFASLEDHIFHAMVMFLSLSLLFIVFSSIFHSYWIQKYYNDILVDLNKNIFNIFYSKSTSFLVLGMVASWQIITTLTILYHSRIWYLVK